MLPLPDMDTMEMEELEGGLVDTEDDAPEKAVYEVGYHLIPSISEDELPAAVSAITDLLKGEGAEFVGERFPSTLPLAYPISRRLSGKRTTFDSAYFGWIAFELGKDSISKLKSFLDTNQNILRYLIVRTDKEAVLAAMSGAVQAVQPTGDIGKPKRDLEGGGELSEAALDEALKTIETEDVKTSE